MGIGDEDLGEGVVGESVADATRKLEIARNQLKIYEDTNAELSELVEYHKQIQDLQDNLVKAKLREAEELIKTQQTLTETLKLRKKAGESVDEELARAEAELANLKEKNKELEKTVALKERDKAISRAREAGAKRFITSMTGLADYIPGRSMIEDMIVDPKGTFEDYSKIAKQMATPMGFLRSTALKVAQATAKLALEQDQAVVSFNRATGASGQFDDNIRNLEDALFTTGVTSAEAGQAVQSLFLNVTDFTRMSEAQQQTLGETVAVLGELGIASETAAKNIQFATKVLGQSTDEAAALQRELFVFAQDLGVSASQIASDFQKFAPQIAALGSEGVDVFKKLEAQAKATGIEIDKLVSMAENFDRFSTAAEAVSGLNAILGGPFLNTVQLVAEQDLSKRLEMIREGVNKSGISFEKMNRLERKALATQLQLNEAQLAMFLRGSPVDEFMPKEKSADDLIALEKQTAQFNTVMEELAQIARELAISFGPVIGGLKTILQGIQKLIPEGSGLGVMVVSLIVVFEKLAISQAKAFLPLGVAYGAYLLLTEIFGVAESTAAALAIGILALGAAMQYLGTSTALATGGLSLLALGASQLATGIMIGFSPSTYGAIMALAGAFLFLAPVMLPILGPIAAIVAGFAGMALVVTGLVGLLDSLGDGGLIDNFRIVAEEIANIVESINKLSEEKTVKFTTSMTAMAESFTGNVSSAAMQSVSNGVAMAAAPATANVPQQTSYNGPPPTFNVNVKIGDKDFATAVTDVELTGGINEKLSKSMSDLLFSHFYK